LVLKNVIILKLNEKATSERLAAVEDALAALPGLIEEIRSYSFGRNLSIVPGAFDFAILSEFDDEASYLAYSKHPEHQRVVAEVLGPLIADRASVQYSTRSDRGASGSPG